jgi:hypothetical protein
MNVEIGAEAALFPEKEYISGIFIAMRHDACDEVIIQLLRFELTLEQSDSWDVIPKIKYNIRHKYFMIALWPETLMQVRTFPL